MFKTEQTYLTLSEYLSEIREVIQDYFFDYQWIIAEIADIKSDKNGRYWFTLVEKKEDEIIAQIEAVLWKGEIVNNFFIKTGINLQKGLKILFSGKAIFHEKYGLKINIYQIDPSYTLGELALMKKEVIERLKKEGLIEKNKENIIPPVIQTIAVISSKRAAGYEDFFKILSDNGRGYKFSILFYDVFVQGQEAVTTIINALKMCSAEAENLDCVVIIRGGGSTVDLQCFNDYELAKNIALLPIPVLTGIGHTRDETVADIVAFKSFKTPSEVAKFILDRAFDFENKIEQLRQSIFHHIESFMKVEKANNSNILLRLKTSIKNSIEKLRSNLNNTTNALQNNILKEFQTHREKLFSFRHDIHQNARIRIKEEEKLINSEENKIKLKISSFITQKNFEIKNFNKNLVDKTVNLLKLKNLMLDRFEEKLQLLSPENILKRGYSIAYINGKAVKTIFDINIGDKVDIHLYKGKFSSIVTEKEDLDGKT